MRVLTWMAPLLALCLLAPPAAAQALDAGALPEIEPLGVQARVTPERVLLGEPFTYEIAITHPKEHRYELDLPSDLGSFEMLSQSRRRDDGQGGAVTTFELRLSAFELGQVRLPDVPFTVATPDGPQRFVAPGRTLEVASTLPEDAQSKGENLRDIQPPTEVPIRSWRLLWALLGMAAVGLLVWGLVRWMNRPRPQVAQVKPLAPLDVRTRQALESLKAEKLPEQGRAKDYYFRLSEIIRAYLGERYSFDALECTSSELLVAVRRLNAPGLPQEALERFVQESDMVKYARAESSPEACQEALAFGFQLLEKTWPPPPPPPTAPAPSHAAGPHVS